MAETLSADFSQLKRFAEDLRRDHAKATRAMGVTAEALVSAVMDVFELEGQVGPHEKWDDLADSTKASRRGGEPFKILQDTGIMAASITPDSGDGFAEAFTDNPYFGYHRTGTKNADGSQRMARRDPYQIDEAAFLEEAEDIFFQFFRRNR